MIFELWVRLISSHKVAPRVRYVETKFYGASVSLTTLQQRYFEGKFRFQFLSRVLARGSSLTYKHLE